MKQPLSEKLKESLKMFLVFFKIGLFSFGGGYAMLAMIEHEVVDKRGWLTHGELLDIFAIAESTPGAISINIATFIGTKRAGVLGGCITTLGVVLPAFLVILALSYILDLVRDNKWVNALFTGVRVGVVVLIIHAALKFLKEMKKKVLTVLLAVAMFCLAAFADINVIYLMLGSIGTSIVAVALAHFWARRKFLVAVGGSTPHYVRDTARTGDYPAFVLALHASPCDGNDTVSDDLETGASSEPCEPCDGSEPYDGGGTVSDDLETGASGASGDGSGPYDGGGSVSDTPETNGCDESCDDCDAVSADLETGCDEPCDDAEDAADKGGADNA